jgi:hypothetical protein
MALHLRISIRITCGNALDCTPMGHHCCFQRYNLRRAAQNLVEINRRTVSAACGVGVGQMMAAEGLQ